VGKAAKVSKLRLCRACNEQHRLTAEEMKAHLSVKRRLARIGLVEGRPPLVVGKQEG